MTDRERLEEAVNSISIPAPIYGKDMAIKMPKEYQKKLVDKLLAEGITFKKKREYIRKSPCKCGASNKYVKVVLGMHNKYYCFCGKCNQSTGWFKTSNEARIEWNKMNEVKNED